MRISDWSSDVCSSDLTKRHFGEIGKSSGMRSASRRIHPSAVPWSRSRSKSENAAPAATAPPVLRAPNVTTSTSQNRPPKGEDRQSVVEGKREAVRGDLGGRHIIKKTKQNNKTKQR